MTRPVKCRFCQVPLQKAADRKADEFVWVDARGRQTGPDPDLAHLKPDPYAYLAALGERVVTGTGRGRRVDHAAGREYSALKVRLESGTWHTHWPDGPGPRHPGPVPECCGWPALLRPSGWYCRQSGKALAQCGAA